MYEKRKYSHVMLVRRVRTRNTKDKSSTSSNDRQASE